MIVNAPLSLPQGLKEVHVAARSSSYKKTMSNNTYLNIYFTLVLSHIPLRIYHLLQPARHRVGQFLQEGQRCALNPQTLQLDLQHRDRRDVDRLQLVLHPIPEVLDRVEVGRVAGPVNDGERLVLEVGEGLLGGVVQCPILKIKHYQFSIIKMTICNLHFGMYTVFCTKCTVYCVMCTVYILHRTVQILKNICMKPNTYSMQSTVYCLMSRGPTHVYCSCTALGIFSKVVHCELPDCL